MIDMEDVSLGHSGSDNWKDSHVPHAEQSTFLLQEGKEM